VNSLRARITVQLVFASVQSFIAFIALVFALFLNFDLFGIRSFVEIPVGAIAFYVIMLVVFGVTFLISGFFLVYEWWENL
jgi:hypothetical protein